MVMFMFDTPALHDGDLVKEMQFYTERCCVYVFRVITDGVIISLSKCPACLPK